MKTRNIRKLIPICLALPLAGTIPASSCGMAQSWDWLTSTNNNKEINYCLLIGQNDHTDSIERTRATRKFLNTLDTSEETKIKSKDNPNVAAPIQGHIEVDDHQGHTTTFVVNEIEQMEQKSMAGATWDTITANATAGTWIAKHGNKITFFVSNNDSMAEGASWASNWIDGLPIFGYDANPTTIQWIDAGKITGTVDQNASTQCGAAMMLLRNCCEDRDLLWQNDFDSSKAHGYGQKKYNPSWRGFDSPNSQTNDEEKLAYGYVDWTLVSEAEFDYGSTRQLLSSSTGIAKLEGHSYLNNVKDYLKDNGEAKEPKDMYDQFTHIKNVSPSTKYEVCFTVCNKAETFIVSILKPYFQEYASRLGLTLDTVEGDGSGEELVLNQIRARPDKYDAFLVNMSKTTSTYQYVLDLAQKAFNYENSKIGSKKSQYLGHTWEWGKEASWDGWDNFEERLDTPLIFYNRQPHTDSGEVDYEILNNKYFKYTYFIGVDSVVGGAVQGEVILEAINKWYADSLKGQ